MNDFLFSLNATIPIFFVIFVGWFLRQRGMLTDEFLNVGNKFVFRVSLPFLLFRDISGANIKEVFDLKYVLYCSIVTSLMFGGIWLFTEIFMKDKSMIGAFVQASFRGSAAILGIAFIENIYGHSTVGPLMIVASVPLYNIYSVLVLTMRGNGNEVGNLRTAFFRILKNPIIIGIFLGLPFSFFQIDFPGAVDKCINYLAVTATPLGLLLVGAGFEGKKALAKIKPTLIATTVKLFILPLIFLPVAMYLGFHGESMIGILIMLASPTTVSCYIMAKNMNNDAVLTSSIIVMATLFSSVSLTFWVFILRTMGFI